MASPDRLVNSLTYSDPNQVTVRSSWWCNSFFGAETKRNDYLQRLSREYLNAENNLVFDTIFTSMDGIINTRIFGDVAGLKQCCQLFDIIRT